MANIDDILKLIEASKLKVDTDKKISIHYNLQN